MRRQQLLPSRPRIPLVPKEIIFPVCQRLAIVLFVMCSTALGLRLWTMWNMRRFAHSNFYPSLAVNGTHFFLDIGSGNSGYSGFSSTRKLEENGWRGVCADPFPDSDRSCMSMAMPVTAVTGQNVKLPDCRGHQQPAAVMAASSATVACPVATRSGVSIGDILKLSNAPRIIDFVNLDANGLELDILKHFPFHKHCVRSWSVVHHNEADRAAKTNKILSARGCRVSDAGPSQWARCSCSDKASSLITAGAEHKSQDKAHEGLVRTAMHGSTAQSRKKHHATSIAAISPTGDLAMSIAGASDAHMDPLAGASSMVGIASEIGESLIPSSLER